MRGVIAGALVIGLAGATDVAVDLRLSGERTAKVREEMGFQDRKRRDERERREDVEARAQHQALLEEAEREYGRWDGDVYVLDKPQPRDEYAMTFRAYERGLICREGKPC